MKLNEQTSAELLYFIGPKKLDLLKSSSSMIVVRAPYEHSFSFSHIKTSRHSKFDNVSLAIAVDLLMGGDVVNSVPIRFLERI